MQQRTNALFRTMRSRIAAALPHSIRRVLPSRYSEASSEDLELLNLCLNLPKAYNVLRGLKARKNIADNDVVARFQRALPASERSLPYQNWRFDLKGEPVAEPAIIGTWGVRLKGNQLRIKAASDTPFAYAFLFVEDFLIKIIRSRASGPDNLPGRAIRFGLKESLLKRLPKTFQLSLGGSHGVFVSKKNTLRIDVENPLGNDAPFKGFGVRQVVTKKGTLVHRKDNDLAWQAKTLDAYSGFQKYFEEKFSYKLFLIYGTLLGMQRNGDFIRHDDDFDTAYMSRCRNAHDVKQEMKSIISQIAADGYCVRFGSLGGCGGLFKPVLETVMFDIFPAWHDGCFLWMNSTTRLDAPEDIFEPVGRASFKERCVYVPNRPIEFLRLKYGEDWRIPDSGYQPVAAPGVKAALERSRITPAEFEIFAAAINAKGNGQVTWPRRR